MIPIEIEDDVRRLEIMLSEHNSTDPIPSDTNQRCSEPQYLPSGQTDEQQLVQLKIELAKAQDDLRIAREAVARFMVPWRFHLSDSWKNHFIEAKLITFDGMGFVRPFKDK